MLRKFKLMFTCKVCDHRNTHMINRLAYTQAALARKTISISISIIIIIIIIIIVVIIMPNWKGGLRSSLLLWTLGSTARLVMHRCAVVRISAVAQGRSSAHTANTYKISEELGKGDQDQDLQSEADVKGYSQNRDPCVLPVFCSQYSTCPKPSC